MNKWFLSLAAALLATAQPAFAQIGSYSPPQVNQPSTSPYLNLLSNNPAARYYGIVRPQFQTQATLHQMQQELYTNQTGFSQLGNSQAQSQGMIVTGHAATFMNYSHYFPTGGQRFAGMGMGPVGALPGVGAGIGGTPTFGMPPNSGIGVGMGVGIGSVFNNQGPAGFRR